MPTRRRCRIAALAVLAVSAALVASPPAGAASCPAGATCGTITVPLDHTGALPGTEPVGYTLLPATGTRAGTLAVLAGGPGQGGAAVTRQLATLLAPVRRSYDLLFVDQRGTGGSGAVSCPSLTKGLTASAVAACGELLGPARATLTTGEDAADLDAVRAALGLDRISLLAVSYGTEIAGEYARLYPEHTERVVLDSPLPIEGPDPFQRLRQLALPRVLREVCFPPGCERTLGTPIGAVAQLARRLARRPIRGTVISGRGRAVRAKFTSTDLYALTAASDLDPFLRTDLPSALASALRGDPAPLLRLVRSAAGAGGDAGVSPARLLATDCIETRLPWDPASTSTADRQKALAAYLVAQRRTFAPFSPLDVTAFSVVTPCLAWPATPKPAGVASRGPDVPVLVLSGREDLRTPLEDARRTASQYPHAIVLAVPDVGHSVLGTDDTGCAMRGLLAFLGGATVEHCVRRTRVPDLFPYVPANLRDLRSPAGAPRAAGRLATALFATLLDVRRQIVEVAASHIRRVGGLRGGTLTVSLTFHRAEMRAYSLVRGVTLTGTLPLGSNRPGHVVLSGPAVKVPGTIAVHGNRVVARLGGRRFEARLTL
jgi:pimeloyl-ACP methyl ester carboxylesterase